PAEGGLDTAGEVGDMATRPAEGQTPLSKRQKRRAYEDRYWSNVLRNALAMQLRQAARKAAQEERVFAEYQALAVEEQAVMAAMKAKG
ncbi:unnamed protein product, partial [Effrenium voratum]